MTIASRNSALSLLALITLVFAVSPLYAEAADYSILNNSFTNASTSNSNIPDHWTVGGFDTIFEGHYPVAGFSDGSAAEISITSCTNSPCGDAKWVFDWVDISGQGGALFTFSDEYNATVPSSLVAAFLHADGSTTYLPIGNALPATSGAWASIAQNFTIPLTSSPVTAVSVYHYISSVGSITTDNYNLSKAADMEHNLLPHGVVSLAFDDGWNSQFTQALPILSSRGLVGSFYVMSRTTQDSSAHDLFADPIATVDMQTTVHTDSLAWSPIYVDPSSNNYFFSETYTADAPVTITASYIASSTPSSIVKTFPAGTNMLAEFEIDLPGAIDSGSLSISQAVATGTLSVVGNPSLVELIDGYMSARQVKLIQEAGNEIGVHTQDHCNLSQLYANSANISSCAHTPSGPTSANQQIVDAQAEILGFVSTPVDTLAYPYGAYSSDVEFLVHDAQFLGARTTVNGYNTLATDHYALQTQIVDSHTTFPMVKAWIDTAVQNHFWLILTFHQVDNPVTSENQGEEGGTTPQIFEQIAQYLDDQNVDVQTVRAELLAVNDLIAMQNATNTPPSSTPSPAPGGGGGGGSPAVTTKIATTSVATTTVATTTPGAVLGASVYLFTRDLYQGMSGEDVIELQKRLVAEGHLVLSTPTGYFGSLTKAAVIKYQQAHGITPAAGYVGPKTRAALNAPASTATSVTGDVQAQIQALLAKIAALRQLLASVSASAQY